MRVYILLNYGWAGPFQKAGGLLAFLLFSQIDNLICVLYNNNMENIIFWQQCCLRWRVHLYNTRIRNQLSSFVRLRTEPFQVKHTGVQFPFPVYKMGCSVFPSTKVLLIMLRVKPLLLPSMVCRFYKFNKRLSLLPVWEFRILIGIRAAPCRF
jgi:hypothetical protein